VTGGPVGGGYTSSTAGDPESVASRREASASDGNSRDLHEVRLLATPLALFVRTRQHHDELLRELTLMSLAHDDQATTHPLPGRLAALVETLGRWYEASASRPDAVRDAAIERGDATVDLTYQVPRSIVADLTTLQNLLEAADEFCRSGELLTLPRDTTMTTFDRWYCEEFVRQLDGRPPRPWTGPLT
jgi:hypothetical protein